MLRLAHTLVAAFVACSAAQKPEITAATRVRLPSEAREDTPALPASAHPAAASASGATATTPVAAEPARESAKQKKKDFESWLRERLPTGGAVTMEDGVATVTHEVQKGETADAIARAYLELTDVYFLNDYVTNVQKAARKAKVSIRAGERIPIPDIVAAPIKTPDEDRMGGPEDGVVRGLYVRGPTAMLSFFPGMLDAMAKRDINAVVLDAKDYDGPVTYASNVPLVKETGAARGAAIKNLARVIRLIHKKGVRVIMRVACFEDELMAKARPALSVQAKWKRPYPIGWLDPSNTASQDYILALVEEVIEQGADEVELDYVRYPVLGIKGADFHLEERNLTKIEVIRDFVRRAHALTQAKGIALSLDVFGVVAQGKRDDIEALGQDLAVLAPEVEAISPMVYPSHYSKGFNGFENPGDHPEIVGIGVKGSLEQMKDSTPRAGAKLAVIRPWIQAEDYKMTNYSPQFLRDEIKASDKNGGSGWLMWNPLQEYSYAWAAVPPKPVPQTPSRMAQETPAKPTKQRRD